MRLERVEVAGFGSLQDVTIDFHPRLTVLLGDNESGKSTLHRAIRAALYGIDAGGQGRPVERSDWARWAPWSRGPYGVALTYRLDDGRRMRVARRLDTREQPVQVLELGGSELTDELRKGRTVTPGRFHLGIDEPVFCATTWLGEEGLGLAAADGPHERSRDLQHAIERLADTGQGSTAAEALRHLREAQQRVGTERRTASQLGGATLRLRELTLRLDEASRQADAIAGERQRLSDLETTAGEAAHRRLDAERRWLRGRIADIEGRLDQLRDTAAEAAEHGAAVEDTRRHAAFPIEIEEEATRLGGELNQASAEQQEASARWEGAHEALAGLRRRRAEIAAGLRAVDSAPQVDADTQAGAARLQGEVAALEAACSAGRVDASADSRIEGLRREIAATGLSAIPAEAVGPMVALLREEGASAWRWRSWWSLAAAIVMVAGAGAGGVLVAAHHAALAAVVAGTGAAAALILALAGRQARAGVSPAAHRLDEIAKRMGLDAAAQQQLALRLPTLQALYAALQLEEGRLESRKAEWAALQATASALAERCAAMAGGAAGTSPAVVRAGTTESLLRQARTSLASLDELGALHRRRQELQQEDEKLVAQEEALQRLHDEAERRAGALRALESRLTQLLKTAGVRPGPTPAESIASLRQACEGRRRHEAARAALGEVQRRAAAFGNEPDLRRLLHQLWEELLRRGDDTDVERAPLGAAELQQLEHEAEHARQAANAAGDQARELRARLAAVLENLPDIADLEDERAAAATERDQALRRRDAIAIAVEHLEQASRRTHRDLAPALAEGVGSRLSLLTGARYTAVNVDTEHFAVSLLCDERPDMLPLAHASHGTRDQVSLLLRIALAETLSAAGEPIPLLLDEPLLTADPRRREAMLRFIHDLAGRDQQVVLTAADPRTVATLRQIASDSDFSVAPMGTDEPLVEASGSPARRMRVLPPAR